MGDGALSNARYRRTPEAAPRRSEPGRLPTGRRLVVVLVGLAVLAALTVAVVVLSGDDDGETSTPTSTSTTGVVGGRAPDVVVAGQILPATFGPGWVEVSREAEPVPAEIEGSDPCASVAQPIATGLVVRAALDHLAPDVVIEKAALVGGVVEEGTVVPRLDDPAVLDCLEQGLRAQVPEGTDLVRADQPTPPASAGAEISGARFDVRDPEGATGARFDLVLLRRDRAVSFVLVAVLAPDRAMPLADLVGALDAPLEAAARRLN